VLLVAWQSGHGNNEVEASAACEAMTRLGATRYVAQEAAPEQ